MLIEYGKTIAYICPYCGRLTKRNITLFDLPPEGACFYCGDEACGECVLTVRHKKDKYLFEVACTACDDRHKFTLKHSGFWKKQLAVLSCPQTMVDIMFIGEDECIDRELAKQNAMYREAEEEIRSTPEIGIYFEIIRVVNELSKEGGISCGVCGRKNFDIELDDSGVRITCRDCRAEAVVGITADSLMELLETGTIVLE
ncbi:MAG: hypothetical protein IJ366_02370 [Clostridia bacterium]|nr:hypothetical protein [Clostridia bacterium]